MTESERLAKIDAYGRYYLDRFRSRVRQLEVALVAARKSCAIAEREYAEGRMVTGNEDGIPTLLRGILKKPPL